MGSSNFLPFWVSWVGSRVCVCVCGGGGGGGGGGELNLQALCVFFFHWKILANPWMEARVHEDTSRHQYRQDAGCLVSTDSSSQAPRAKNRTERCLRWNDCVCRERCIYAIYSMVHKQQNVIIFSLWDQVWRCVSGIFICTWNRSDVSVASLHKIVLVSFGSRRFLFCSRIFETLWIHVWTPWIMQNFYWPVQTPRDEELDYYCLNY